MKITIQNAAEQKPNNTYPYFGINVDERIVLFIGEGKGINIHKGRGLFVPNGNIDSWDESSYETFNGTIKIEQ